MACSRRSQIYVEIVESALRRNQGRCDGCESAVDTVVMIALVTMVFVGFHLCVDCRTQKTGILVLSYFYVYLIMPVGVSFMILMMIKKLIQDTRKGLEPKTVAAH